MSFADMLVFFLEDVTEMLTTWEEQCLLIESGKKKPEFDELFRIAHNLKGSAKMVDLDVLGSFIHKVEDVINLLRDGKISFDIKLINLFLDVHSFLITWVSHLADNPAFVPDLTKMETALMTVIEGSGSGIIIVDEKLNVDENAPKRENPQKVKELLKEIKKYVPSKAQTEEVHLCDDLVISNMGKIMEKYRFDPNKKFKIFLDIGDIDMAGVQYLLCLKLSSDIECEFVITKDNIKEALTLAGVEGQL